MKEIEKLKAGMEYCYSDDEVYALKENALRNCDIYNSINNRTENNNIHRIKSLRK